MLRSFAVFGLLLLVGRHAPQPAPSLAAFPGTDIFQVTFEARSTRWMRGDAPWREVANLAAHRLSEVTRMAAAPDGKTLAIVVAEPAK